MSELGSLFAINVQASCISCGATPGRVYIHVGELYRTRWMPRSYASFGTKRHFQLYYFDDCNKQIGPMMQDIPVRNHMKQDFPEKTPA